MSFVEATKFHKQLKAFLKNLILVFPDDRDIKVISSTLNIAMMDDPDAVIVTTFYEALAPHDEMILNRDDEFFYQDPHNIMKNTNVNSQQFQLFNKLNIYWETLHISNRAVVWDYVEMLYALSKDIVGKMSNNSISNTY